MREIVLGELGVICNSERCANIICKSGVSLLVVKGSTYMSYCNNNLGAAKMIIKKLASSLANLTKDYQSLALSKLDHRVMKTLIQLSSKINDQLIVAQTHHQIAERVAASRESVSRAISNLQKNNLVSCKSNQIILNNKLLDIYSQI